MAKISFFAILALFAIVAVTADTQEDVQGDQVENVEEYGLSCKFGKVGCSASCVAQGHLLGGYCNSENTCICN